MKIKPVPKILLFVLMTISGCTQFRTWVNVSLEPRDDTVQELFSIVETIAEKYDLHKDKSHCVPGKKLSFFGNPYHYYTFEIKDSTESVIVVKFDHDAMVSMPNTTYCEPENEFLQEIKSVFDSEIIELEYNILE